MILGVRWLVGMATPSVNIDSLTEDQQLALQQFTSVTDQELDAALPLLQKCQWNAQVALLCRFDRPTGTQLMIYR